MSLLMTMLSFFLRESTNMTTSFPSGENLFRCGACLPRATTAHVFHKPTKWATSAIQAFFIVKRPDPQSRIRWHLSTRIHQKTGRGRPKATKLVRFGQWHGHLGHAYELYAT